MNNNQLSFSDKASNDRPAWTSEESTGMLHAYRHLHVSKRPDEPIDKDYFVITGGRF